MNASLYNFDGITGDLINIGATFDVTMTYRDGSNALVNLTGYSAQLTAVRNIGDVTPWLDMSTANGRIILGGVAGTIQFLLTAAQTAALVVQGDEKFPRYLDRLKYKFNLTNGSTVIPMLYGTMVAVKDA